MSDEEKGSSVHTSDEAPDLSDSEEEAAAAKLWAVYVSEAEKYNKALVESWKSDMEGMLIFAGLFSASLTAFIIESYKTLIPDSGDSTVQLLTQISQQLAAAANGTTFTPPAPTVFSPPVTSLVCNALWFISLGLSLTCALIATLLEQWARDFLHRADMHSAPVVRARIFAYLYYGLKRFNMHIVVEIIPLLLHASLVFFFAGLVAFLIPVNIGMAGLAVALLAIVAAAYSFLTLIPLQYLDCPYRTPLSGTLWRLSRRWQSPLSNSGSSSTETMVEAMSCRATEPSAARTSRDFQALAWTVSSLADDTELEPFVEGIPDVLWGPSRRRYAYEHSIQRLLREPDLHLFSRIEGLLRSCDSGLLSPEAFTRRHITCEQWSRDFLHRADMRSAPVIRARIFSYLYYGLKRFNMHMVVEIIPLLLHASLVFFFAGLVAFLIPINIAMTGVAAALLTIVAAVYSFLTLIPSWYLDCPYRTPLSGAFWRLSRRWQSPLSNSDSSSTTTMVEAMSRRATEPSAARTSRDVQALAWTMKSLADDTELEPFVEGIPDVLWGPTERRYTYDDRIQRLMDDPDLRLLSRIEGLLRSCDSGLLSPEAFTRRHITCLKAMWAIASMQHPGTSPNWQPLDSRINYLRLMHRPDLGHYFVSALALMNWSVFCSMLGRLAELSNYLAVCAAEYDNAGRTRNLAPIRSYLRFALDNLDIHFPEDGEYIYGADPTLPPPRLIAGLSRVLVNLRTTTPHRILFHYLERSTELESPPYRWNDTREIIALDHTTQFSTFKNILEHTLDNVVVYGGLDRLNDTKTSGWMDTVIQALYACWTPDQTCEPTALPTAIIHYLNNRTSDDALSQFVFKHDLKMWSAFPITLSPASYGVDPGVPIDKVLTALWRISVSPFHDRWPSNGDLRIYEAVLEGVKKISSSSSSTLSVVPMVKIKILDALEALTWSRTFEEWPLNHWLLSTETALSMPPEFLEGHVSQLIGTHSSSLHYHLVQSRVVETRIALIAEFLDNCNSGLDRYKAGETLRHIGATMPHTQIHASHQTRLANGMNRAANSHEPDVELLDAVISCEIFDLYADMPGSAPSMFRSERHAWLDDATARRQIKDILSRHVQSRITNPSPMQARAEAIVRGLNRLHVTVIE